MEASDFVRFCLTAYENAFDELFMSAGVAVKAVTEHIYIPMLPQRFRWRGYRGEIVLKGKRIFCVLRTEQPLVAVLRPVQIKAHLPKIRFVDYVHIDGAEWVKKPMVSYTKVALYV